MLTGRLSAATVTVPARERLPRLRGTASPFEATDMRSVLNRLELGMPSAPRLASRRSALRTLALSLCLCAVTPGCVSMTDSRLTKSEVVRRYSRPLMLFDHQVRVVHRSDDEQSLSRCLAGQPCMTLVLLRRKCPGTQALTDKRRVEITTYAARDWRHHGLLGSGVALVAAGVMAQMRGSGVVGETDPHLSRGQTLYDAGRAAFPLGMSTVGLSLAGAAVYVYYRTTRPARKVLRRSTVEGIVSKNVSGCGAFRPVAGVPIEGRGPISSPGRVLHSCRTDEAGRCALSAKDVLRVNKHDLTLWVPPSLVGKGGGQIPDRWSAAASIRAQAVRLIRFRNARRWHARCDGLLTTMRGGGPRATGRALVELTDKFTHVCHGHPAEAETARFAIQGHAQECGATGGIEACKQGCAGGHKGSCRVYVKRCHAELRALRTAAAKAPRKAKSESTLEAQFEAYEAHVERCDDAGLAGGQRELHRGLLNQRCLLRRTREDCEAACTAGAKVSCAFLEQAAAICKTAARAAAAKTHKALGELTEDQIKSLSERLKGFRELVLKSLPKTVQGRVCGELVPGWYQSMNRVIEGVVARVIARACATEHAPCLKSTKTRERIYVLTCSYVTTYAHGRRRRHEYVQRRKEPVCVRQSWLQDSANVRTIAVTQTLETKTTCTQRGKVTSQAAYAKCVNELKAASQP